MSKHLPEKFDTGKPLRNMKILTSGIVSNPILTVK